MNTLTLAVAAASDLISRGSADTMSPERTGSGAVAKNVMALRLANTKVVLGCRVAASGVMGAITSPMRKQERCKA